MLRNAVGPQVAAAVVLFGEVLDGPAAARTGLAWSCVPPGELLPVAIAFAAGATGKPAPLVAAAKETLRDMAGVDRHDDAVARELGTQVWSIKQGWLKTR